MAHIFNIYFTYQLLTYSAMVSVRRNPFYTEYILQHVDEILMAQLPAASLISNAPNRLFFRDHPDEPLSELAEAIVKAVAEHMKSAAY